MLGLDYWMLPLVSAVIWLAMILTLLITWVTDGRPHYPSMVESQTIAYISDVGAQKLKPLFISMASATVVLLDLAFLLERWLRHRGRLAANTSRSQKALSTLASIAAVAGGLGLILLSIFDTWRHKKLHDAFLTLFIAGYVISAVFICAEYQRLGKRYREFRILRISFWIKLAFILTEVALAIAFGSLNKTHHYNAAAIVEWVISLIFTFYVASFALDFLPALDTQNGHHHRTGPSEMAIAEEEGALRSPAGARPEGRYYGDGYVKDSHHHGNGAGRYGRF